VNGLVLRLPFVYGFPCYRVRLRLLRLARLLFAFIVRGRRLRRFGLLRLLLCNGFRLCRRIKQSEFFCQREGDASAGAAEDDASGRIVFVNRFAVCAQMQGFLRDETLAAFVPGLLKYSLIVHMPSPQKMGEEQSRNPSP